MIKCDPFLIPRLLERSLTLIINVDSSLGGLTLPCVHSLRIKKTFVLFYGEQLSEVHLKEMFSNSNKQTILKRWYCGKYFLFAFL